MTLGRSISLTRTARWTAGALAAFAVTLAYAQTDTVPIRFTKSFTPILTTNLTELMTGQRRKSLDEMLSENDVHAIGTIFRDDAFDSPMPTGNRSRLSPAAAQRYREAVDRKKNWAFTIESDMDPAAAKVRELSRFLDVDAKASENGKHDLYLEAFDRMGREGNRDPLAVPGDTADTALSGMGDGTTDGTSGDSGTGIGSSVGKSGDDDNHKPVASGWRSPLGMGSARSEGLSSFGGRSATDFRTFDADGGSLGGVSSSGQRARMDMFRSLIDKPVASAGSSVPKPSAPSALSSAMSSLGAPATSFGGSPASSLGTRGSFLERFDPTPPSWKSSSAGGLASPNYGNPPLAQPPRMVTPTPTIPTRR